MNYMILDECPYNASEVEVEHITVFDRQQPNSEFQYGSEQPFGQTGSNEFDIDIDAQNVDIYTIEITTRDIVVGEITITVVSEISGTVDAVAVSEVNTEYVFLIACSLFCKYLYDTNFIISVMQ